MAVYSVETNGTERDVLVDSLRFRRVANGIGTISVDFDADGPTPYRPAIDDELVVKKDGAVFLGGVITSAPEEGLGGPALDDIVTKVTASTFDIYATYRFVTVSIPAGTLKAALTVLVAYLSTHGVTLHASQVDGPNLPDLNFTRVRLDNILGQLTTLTDYQYLWRITANKELEMYQPSAAPFNVTDGVNDPVHQRGDVIVERTVNELYANRVILTISGAGPATSSEQFTAADGVSAGGFTRFTTKYPASTDINDVWTNVLTFDGAIQGPIAWAPNHPIPNGFAWTWDPANHQLVYDESTGAAFPTGSEVIAITYSIAYPFDVTANNVTEQNARGIIERLLSVDQAMSLTTAQAYADAFVANASREIVKARYETWDDGLEPGQQQVITQAKRAVDDTFLVLEVAGSVLPQSDASFLRYDVTAVEGPNLESDWRQVYRDWLGGGKASSGGVAITNVGAAVSPSAGIQIAVLRLSDAEIKAAADTPVLVIPAPGGGSPSSCKRIKVLAASMRLKTENGAYSNIDPDYAAAHLVANGKRLSTGWYNDSATPVGAFSDLFGAAHDKVGDLPVPAMDAIAGFVGSQGSPQTEQWLMGEDAASMADVTDVEDQGVYLLLDNNGAGPFTGGHATNRLKLTVYYLLEDVCLDWTPPPSLRQVFVSANTQAGVPTTLYTTPFNPTFWQSVESDMPVPWPVPGVLRNLKIELTANHTRTVTVRINGSDTALEVALSDEMSGSAVVDVPVAAGDLVTLRTDGSLNSVRHLSIEFEATTPTASGYANYGGGHVVSSALYNALFRGKNGWSFDSLTERNVVAAPGVVTGVYVGLGTAPGGSASRTFTIYKNGVAQDGSGGTPDTRVTITGAATSGSSAFSLAVTTGDLVALESAPADSPANTTIGYGVAFTATVKGQSQFCGNSSSVLHDTQTHYVTPAAHAAVGWSATESTVEGGSGISTFQLVGLVVRVSSQPGSGGDAASDSYTFTGRVNQATPGGAPTVTITNTETAKSTTSGVLTIADGDTASLQCVPSGTPASPQAIWSFVQVVN